MIGDTPRDQFFHLGINLSSHAPALIKSDDFYVVDTPEKIALVNVSPRELGFSAPVSLQEACERGKQYGLSRCPPEVGPKLRQVYCDQSPHECMVVITEAIATPYGPALFAVWCDGLEHPWLSVWRGEIGTGNRLIFCLDK